MTRDADNDNPTGVAARKQAHAQEQVQSWQGQSHGNAALADQPEPHIEDQILEDEIDHSAEPVENEPAVGPPSLPETSIIETAATGSAVQHASGLIPNSNAIPISALGISIPRRPIPAVQQTEVQVRAPQAPVRRRQHSADLGKQGSEHLFNLPPRPAQQQAEPSPMEQAINAKPRTPLTSQPGFLAGLVAALVSGGAVYGYLVF